MICLFRVFGRLQIYLFLFVLAGLGLFDWAIHKAVGNPPWPDLTTFKAFVPPPTDEQFEEMVYLDCDGKSAWPDYIKETGKQKIFSKSYTANFEEYLSASAEPAK